MDTENFSRALQKMLDEQNNNRIDYPVIHLANKEPEIIDLESSLTQSLSNRSDNDTDK